MTFVKKQLAPFSSAPADPLFIFTQPFIQQGVISGRYYSAEEVSYGNPKPGYLQVTENSDVVTVVASTGVPLRLVFALGLHDANTGGEIGSWRTFTGKSVSNANVTITASEKAWIYAEINENGQPNNPTAWTIQYASEPAKDRRYSSQADEPNAPVDGDVWFNPITNLLKKYDADTSQWITRKRVYLGEAGVGQNNYVYTVQSWFPELGYAEYQDSFYAPYYENPWRHYDGVSFTTNGQYTAMEAANWANNFTIAQAVVGNQIAMNAVANSATAMSGIVTAANSVIALGNSELALLTLPSNTTGAAIGFVANSSLAMNNFANTANVVNFTANSFSYFSQFSNSSVAMSPIANSSVAMSVYANNANVMNNFSNSSVAMGRIANSSVGFSISANSSVAMGAIANSLVAMNNVGNSSIAMNNIQISTTAISAIANSPHQNSILNGPFATSFLANTAQNATILSGLAAGDQGNILFSLIANTTHYNTIVGNSTYRNALIDSRSGPILATGGTVSTSGTFRVHEFTGGTTFQTYGVGEHANNMQYLVVAGGGGGATYLAGGGGGGGYRTNVPGQLSGGTPGTAEGSVTIDKNTGYTITIGGGGAAATGQPNPSGDGSNSSIGSLIVSVGGGGGGGFDSGPGKNGGSGGGKYSNSQGSGIAGQGHNGGQGYSPFGGGGGGGAAAAGPTVVSPSTTPGALNGAPGRSSPITGSSVVRGSGGGGGGGSSTGGPGAGNESTAPASPTSNAEALRGGGGGGRNSISGTAGAGGSGIVVIRYPLVKV